MAEEDNTESDEIMHCAGCGVQEGDDIIKLRKCNGCYLVRYCGVKCQKDHRPKHKKDCKKRAAELRDEILFKQPESSYLGDCPICCLPLSIDTQKSCLYSCCSKRICNGCDYANEIREKELRLQRTCPFCRHPVPESEEEVKFNYMKRVEANDPEAMTQMGSHYIQKGDYKKAFEYLTKAAELGGMNAHFNLSRLYHDGQGVEKNKKKEFYHLEEAAIGGDPFARHNLGCEEARMDRAVKHWIIAAKQGDEFSLKKLTQLYRDRIISEEVFGTVLRGHKAAVDATKSPQRAVAEAVTQARQK